MRVNDNIGSKMQYFLSTGNLVSQSGLDLQQVSGYTVVAEKLISTVLFLISEWFTEVHSLLN